MSATTIDPQAVLAGLHRPADQVTSHRAAVAGAFAVAAVTGAAAIWAAAHHDHPVDGDTEPDVRGPNETSREQRRAAIRLVAALPPTPVRTVNRLLDAQAKVARSVYEQTAALRVELLEAAVVTGVITVISEDDDWSAPAYAIRSNDLDTTHAVAHALEQCNHYDTVMNDWVERNEAVVQATTVSRSDAHLTEARSLLAVLPERIADLARQLPN